MKMLGNICGEGPHETVIKGHVFAPHKKKLYKCTKCGYEPPPEVCKMQRKLKRIDQLRDELETNPSAEKAQELFREMANVERMEGKGANAAKIS